MVLGLSLGLWQLTELQGQEQDVQGHWQRLQDLEVIADQQLVAATLGEGQSAIFELCVATAGALDPTWAQIEATVLFTEEGAVAHRQSLGDLTADAYPEMKCFLISQSESLRVTGEYAIGVATTPLPPPLATALVRGRILAWKKPGSPATASLLFGLLGAFLLCAGALCPQKDNLYSAELEAQNAPPRLAFGLAAFVVAMVLPGRLLAADIAPSFWLSATGHLVAALLIAGTEVHFGLRSTRSLTSTPKRRWLAAPLLGIALWLTGRVLTSLLPSSGTAPVELFVSVPSGTLAMGLVALAAPIAEELFFRGFVYNHLEKRSATFALIGTSVLFALVHLPQQWGAWGAFASVSLTGAVLTLLRFRGAPVALCALVHLSHNAAITLFALR